MPKTLTAETIRLNPSLLAFKPRQLLLLSNTTTAMNPYYESQLLLSIADYSHRKGFSKTLKKFLKDANLKKDDLGTSSFDLEKVICEFLHTRDNAGKTEAIKKTEALQANGTSEEGHGVTTKTKKKKSGSDDTSGAIEKNVESKNTEESKTEKLKENSEIVYEIPDKKQKEQKRKKNKNKLHSESQIDNDESSKGRKEDRKVVDNIETKAEQKDKKKKTKKSSNASLDNIEQDGSEAKQDELTGKQKEGSKKRKRSAAEKEAEQTGDNKVVEESKRRKTEVSEESERNGHKDSGSSQKVPAKELDAQANRNLEKNGENSGLQKTSKKQQNGSAEPTTGRRFQRVKVEEVVFSNEKLKDNSYWAKDGAEMGYGAKAEEVLGKVKGRDFRHEKTKKKRGSYRGGKIDLQSHSIKFNYSDDE